MKSAMLGICRCCLTATSTLSDKSLDAQCNQWILHIDKIIECFTDLQIENRVNYQLCKDCVDMLNVVYDMRQTIYKSNIIYNNYLKEISFHNNNNNKTVDGEPKAQSMSIILFHFEPEEPDTSLLDNVTINSDNCGDIKGDPFTYDGEAVDENILMCSDDMVQKLVNSIKLEASQLDLTDDFIDKSLNDTSSLNVCDLSIVDKIDLISSDAKLEQLLDAKQDVDVTAVDDPSKPEATPSVKKPLLCKHCSKPFHIPASLRRHERGHTELKTFSCKYCSKTFSRLYDLQRHERVHTGERPFLCKHCTKSFSQSANLIKHELTHTMGQTYPCKFCNKGFNRKDHLREHEKIHTGVKPNVCKHCNKAFTRAFHLRVHERIHSSERPYVCKCCNKSFEQMDTLEMHERKHTEASPYTCAFCNKAFVSVYDVKRHERVHTGERPYVCKFCNKTFTQSANLVKHERIHTGERPFACKHCGKSFNRKDHLRLHERTHTG